MSERRRWRLFGPALLRVVPRDRQTLAGRVPDSLQFLERFWEPTSFRTEGDDPWIWPTDRPPHLALRSHAVPMADHLPSSLRRARVLPPPWPCATCSGSPRSVSVRRAPWATVARERWQMRARPSILTLDLSLLSSRQERGLAWLFLIVSVYEKLQRPAATIFTAVATQFRIFRRSVLPQSPHAGTCSASLRPSPTPPPSMPRFS
ncbi:hypothetical protein NUW54_g12290 [Trametes sanguinea]|uniref:Uncharacterized protein n=1 Tax=Trametes sanguinea TaxID=158606 RepID=A0ACC1MZA6_9APHY|nr:hypothetical protein NUW54_g12290 [Trametes sanguinea]